MVKEQKLKEVQDLLWLIESHNVIGVLSMHKLPAKQLAQIKMSKKSLMLKAVDGSKKKDVGKIKGRLQGPSALLFTNENPFRLFRLLKESRIPATAKAGDMATKDITVQKGPTGLPPGPAISALQKIGLKASVQGGKISVLQDKVVCKAGERVSEDLANVLALLKVEPLEIGLDMVAAYEDGTVYGRDVLDVSVDDYVRELRAAVHHAFNLSINTNYPTKQTIELIIQKAFDETKNLAAGANIFEKDFIDEVLLKAVLEGRALEAKVGA